MSLQIACSMLNDSCHALCMYSTVYYECRAGSGLVPGPPRPHHPPSCFPHYPSPSRPCPGCVFLCEMSISSWAPPEQDGTIQILQKHIAEETMQVNDRRSTAKSKTYCVFEFAFILIMIRFSPMLAQDVFIQTQHAQSMASSI